MNDTFLQYIIGTIGAVLVIAVIGTPIYLLTGYSRKDSWRANVKRYFGVMVRFIGKFFSNG